MSNLKLTTDEMRQVLKHLERAGHDRLGECHKVYPTPGTWDIEMDVMPCDYGKWLPDDSPGDKEVFIDSEEGARTECKECTCGYLVVLSLLKNGLPVAGENGA